jgi:hypothetical protein
MTITSNPSDAIGYPIRGTAMLLLKNITMISQNGNVKVLIGVDAVE